MENIYKKIPKIDKILDNDKIKNKINKYGRNFTLKIIRRHLDSVRDNIEKNIISRIDEEEIINTILYLIEKENKNKFQKVINGTGIIIHTNLGRSIFSESIAKEIQNNLISYTNLEYNLEKAERGHRNDHIIEIIKEITSAEDAVVVNNNAAAVLLTLKTIAQNKEVIVSRGELVEIGGSFRVPEIIKESGCKLIEVGTTNKTHLKDYEKAITENTGAIIKIHTSNYKIVGFTKEVEGSELKKLANKYNIPLIEDLGSGMLIDLSEYGLSKEPTVNETLNNGVDIITFSGDKLLGGPQCGVIVGKRKYIDKIRNNQLMRVLRVDKFTIMSLELTLKAYLNKEKISEKIPTIRMITEKENEVKERAEKLQKELKKLKNKNLEIELISCNAMVGGGSYPVDIIKSWGIKIIFEGYSESKLEEYLRNFDIPVITRLIDGNVVIDCKTILPDDYKVIKKAFLDLIGVENE